MKSVAGIAYRNDPEICSICTPIDLGLSVIHGFAFLITGADIDLTKASFLVNPEMYTVARRN